MKFDGMIKSIILVIAGIIILTSFTEVLAQENISVLLGKNVKEWHSIGVALISEGKHEEAIKYYDKILELNPNDEKALVNNRLFGVFMFAHRRPNYLQKVSKMIPEFNENPPRMEP